MAAAFLHTPVLVPAALNRFDTTLLVLGALLVVGAVATVQDWYRDDGSKTPEELASRP